jgi:hypothetical protein
MAPASTPVSAKNSLKADPCVGGRRSRFHFYLLTLRIVASSESGGKKAAVYRSRISLPYIDSLYRVPISRPYIASLYRLPISRPYIASLYRVTISRHYVSSSLRRLSTSPLYVASLRRLSISRQTDTTTCHTDKEW